jgi:hypothetical protein
VDNRLATGINTVQTALGRDARRLWPEAIASATWVLLLRVSDIDDDACDPHVIVSIYRGVPDFVDGCRPRVPGQAFAVLREDLLPGATSADAARYTFDAMIVDHRLVVTDAVSADRTTMFSFEPVFGMPSNMLVHGAQMRVQLSPQSLTAGNFGGYLLGADVLRVAISIDSRYEMLLMSAIGGLLDMQLPLYPDPTGICVSTVGSTTSYGGFSIGFGFTAVSATISTTTPIADGPLPGRCGTPATSDAGGSG